MSRGAYIQTQSGRRWHFLNPRVEDVDLDDIVFALAHLNRYTGHAGSYSVLSHSLLVGSIVVAMGFPHYECAALAHDFSEAYLGDVASPLKYAMREVDGARSSSHYDKLYARTEEAVFGAIGIQLPLSPVVGRADLAALGDEARDLLYTNVAEWGITEPPSGLPVIIETPIQAMTRFYDRWSAAQRARAA